MALQTRTIPRQLKRLPVLATPHVACGLSVFRVPTLAILVLFVLSVFVPHTWGWTVTPQNVTFVNAQGITLSGKLFTPAGNGSFPAIVMMHGCSGIYSNSDPQKGVATLYREWGDRLVQAGYVALLVDSFTPRNAAQDQCGNGAAGVSEVGDRPYDAYAAHNFLAANTALVQTDHIGLLGWSHGGSSTMATMDVTMVPADSQPFQAAVAFYPGCGLYNAFGGLAGSTYVPYAPFLILHGAQDALYQSGACDQRRSRAVQFGASIATGNPMDMTVYPGAHHSFDQAKAINSQFTQADLDAKAAADTATLAYFALYVQ